MRPKLLDKASHLSLPVMEYFYFSDPFPSSSLDAVEMKDLFYPVAQSMGIEVYAPEDGFISFFNSPYYSHMNALAVDIYPNPSGTASCAPSPVEGTITDVYKFKAPQQRYFKTPEEEQLILISPTAKPELWVRILHVDCQLEIGEQVAVGDSLGVLERSGFFNFWTSRHMHVEIRGQKEPLRAKGAFPMRSINPKSEFEGSLQDEKPVLEIKASGGDYFLADYCRGFIRWGGFWGLGCMVNHQLGILDCGLPHYDYGGVHLKDPSSINVGDPVRLWGMNIGSVTRVCENFALFRSRPLKVRVNGASFRGLSLYLWLKDSKTVKLIPEKPATHAKAEWSSHIKTEIRLI